MKDPLLDSGAILSHYRVLSLLGAGGMGEVYLAEDVRLGRRVALKLLSTEFTKDEERVRRFEQEARAVSLLNHPNIITIYEVGKAETIHFIATEFIEGQTLRNYSNQVRPNLQEVLDIAIQIATALAAAHAAGVVHRDIKPENIMLRPDGYVKVLDFGLAKLIETETTSGSQDAPTVPMLHTEPGVLMGTVSYMSPEQGRGHKMDSRTDVFSFGILLYEMIGGRVPFEGSTPSDVIAAILEREPPPLPRYAPNVPAELERIVSKALRKNRDDRYQTIKDLWIDLKAVRQELAFSVQLERSLRSGSDSGAGVASRTIELHSAPTEVGTPVRPMSSAEYLISEMRRHKKTTLFAVASLVLAGAGIFHFASGSRAIDSVAVLPFISMSQDPGTEFLTDDITEKLINSLSQLPTLKVMSYSSVFRYKNQQVDPRTVGQDLSVKAVLTGRVVQRSDDLTISVELVDARDNSRIWGEQYNKKLADILLFKEEIANTIAQKLNLQSTGQEKKRLDAYQLYTKGRHFWSRRTTEGLRKGIELFDEAIRIDPGYVLAYAGLADSYNMLVIYSAEPPREAFPKAKEAAMKALEADDGLAEAHTSLAFVLERFDWDFVRAEAEYKRAIELKPAYASGHHRYGVFLCQMGRFAEAVKELRTAQQLEPLSLIINADSARPLYFARKYDEAIQDFRKTIEMDPNFGPAHRYLALAYLQKGMHSEAIAELQKAAVLSGDSALMKAELGHAYAISGRKAEARRILEDLIGQSQHTYIPSFYMAIIHVGLGEKDQAFEWLEKAYAERSNWLAVLKVDPTLDTLRSDRRFSDLISRVGLSR